MLTKLTTTPVGGIPNLSRQEIAVPSSSDEMTGDDSLCTLRHVEQLGRRHAVVTDASGVARVLELVHLAAAQPPAVMDVRRWTVSNEKYSGR
jgi:hypothetical protein